MRFLCGGRVRRNTNLLHPKRLGTNISHGLLLPFDVAHALVPRATIRIPVFVPEGNAVRLCPKRSFPCHARHFLLLILVLQGHLLGLRFATIFGVLRDRRDGEPRLLVHHDLEPLIQRLVNHVVHHASRITRTGRFTPRAKALRRNPLLSSAEEAIALHQVQVHLHRLASALPQAATPRRPCGRVDVFYVVGGRKVVSVQRTTQRSVIL